MPAFKFFEDRRRNMRFKAQIQQIRNDIEAAAQSGGDLTAIEADIAALESDMANSNTVDATHGAALATLQADLATAQAATTAAQAMAAQANVSAVAAQASADAAVAAAAAAQADADTTAAELDTAETDIDTLADTATTTVADIAALNALASTMTNANHGKRVYVDDTGQWFGWDKTQSGFTTQTAPTDDPTRAETVADMPALATLEATMTAANHGKRVHVAGVGWYQYDAEATPPAFAPWLPSASESLARGELTLDSATISSIVTSGNLEDITMTTGSGHTAILPFSASRSWAGMIATHTGFTDNNATAQAVGSTPGATSSFEVPTDGLYEFTIACPAGADLQDDDRPLVTVFVNGSERETYHHADLAASSSGDDQDKFAQGWLALAAGDVVVVGYVIEGGNTEAWNFRQPLERTAGTGGNIIYARATLALLPTDVLVPTQPAPPLWFSASHSVAGAGSSARVLVSPGSLDGTAAASWSGPTWTVPRAGLWQITLRGYVSGSTSATHREHQINVNGAWSVISPAYGGPGTSGDTTVELREFAEGDQVQFATTNSHSATLTHQRRINGKFIG